MNGDVNINTVGDLVCSAVLSGSGSIVKNGVGEMALSAANTYNGTTTINGGLLGIGWGIGESQAFGNTSSIVLNGGGLDLNSQNFSRSLSMTTVGGPSPT